MHIGKQLNKKPKVNSRIEDVTDWKTNNYNRHITRYSTRKDNQTMKFGQFVEYEKKKFLKIRSQNVVEKLVLVLF